VQVEPVVKRWHQEAVKVVLKHRPAGVEMTCQFSVGILVAVPAPQKCMQTNVARKSTKKRQQNGILLEVW
jgi:hypothetical protein